MLLVPATAHAAMPGTASPNVPAPAGSVHLNAPGLPQHRAGVAAPLDGQPPVFNDYLVCFNGNVFTDFTDPDGNDVNLNVAIFVLRNGEWSSFWMVNSGESVHGVFFFLDLATVGVNPADVAEYAFLALDETGLTSTSWVLADPNCNIIAT
jgi:hypothetical protein